MYTDPPKESARQRAERIWRNNAIMHQYKRKPQTIDESSTQKHLNSIIRREILAIFHERNDGTIMKYITSINVRRRALLKEKLRRLTMEKNNG